VNNGSFTETIDYCYLRANKETMNDVKDVLVTVAKDAERNNVR
jgi:hypothetical protein